MKDHVGRKSARKEKQFDVGDELLVENGTDFNNNRKRAAFDSYFYGNIRVIKAVYPRYELISSAGRITRKQIPSQKLVSYWKRPAQLLKH